MVQNNPILVNRKCPRPLSANLAVAVDFFAQVTQATSLGHRQVHRQIGGGVGGLAVERGSFFCASTRKGPCTINVARTPLFGHYSTSLVERSGPMNSRWLVNCVTLVLGVWFFECLSFPV